MLALLMGTNQCHGMLGKLGLGNLGTEKNGKKSIEAIEDSLPQILEDTSLGEYKKYTRLAQHYQIYRDALKASESPDEKKIAAAEEARIENLKAAEAARNREIETKQIQARINRIAKMQPRDINKMLELIPDYERLCELHPADQTCKNELTKLRKGKLRCELNHLVTELKEVNNKEGLIKVYTQLMDTHHKEENKKHYRLTIEELQLQITQEELEQAAEREQAFIRLEKEKIAEERAAQEAAERLEQEQLRVAEMAAISRNIIFSSNPENYDSEYVRKITLAHFLKEHAQLAQGAEDDRELAKHEFKKASDYGYVAYGLAKTDREKAIADELLKLLP